MSLVSNPSRGASLRAFTLMELMVVMVILVLLIGILLPALHSARRKAGKVKSQAELTAIAQACESYQLTFQGNAPGYLSETDISETQSVRENFTGNENLVLSLLGGVVAEGASGTNQFDQESQLPNNSTFDIDIDRIGLGATSPSGRQFGSFYTPTDEQLATITGTVGDDNNMPELVDSAGRVPILYFRAGAPLGTKPMPVGFCQSCSDAPSFSGGADYFVFLRATNVDYLDATGLEAVNGTIANNYEFSLFSADHANSFNGPGGRGPEAIADNQLAWFTVHKSMSDTGGGDQYRANQPDDEVKGSFVLIAAGSDSVYADSGDNDGLITQIGDVKNFDDVSVVGGIQ